MGLRLLERKAALGVYQMLGIMGKFARFHIQDGNGTFADSKGFAHGIPDTAVVSGLRYQTVYHKFYEVRFIAVQGHFRDYVLDFSVHSHLSVTALTELLKEIAVMAFSASYERRQQVALPACEFLHYKVYNLGVIVTHHLKASFRRYCT